jgi:NB-ARC domain
MKIHLERPALLEEFCSLLHESIVQVKTSDCCGKGFFVGSNTILTCANLVQDTDIQLIKISQGNKVYNISSLSINEDINTAIIKINDDEERSISPTYLDTDFQIDDVFYIEQDLLDSKECFFICQSYSGLSRLIAVANLSRRPLMIGSPVLNCRTLKVCGMITRASSKLEYSQSIHGNTISVAAIFQEMPDIKLSNQVFHHIHQSSMWLENLNKHSSSVHSYYLLEKYNNRFIGRSKEIKTLLDYLSIEYRQPIIVISGAAGVGKTALALEVARLCWEKNQNTRQLPSFKSIVFTSFRNNTSALTSSTFTSDSLPRFGLSLMFLAIAKKLQIPEINHADETKQIEMIYKALAAQPTLLIIDGVKSTLSDKYSKLTQFLSKVPTPTKVIITAREDVLFYSDISLKPLSTESSIQLIEEQARKKGVSIDKKTARSISNSSCGMPIAILYSIGQIAAKYNKEKILKRINVESENAGECIFEQSIFSLQGQPSHTILMSLLLFRYPPCRDALLKVSELPDNTLHTTVALRKLQQLSLITEFFEGGKQRYSILPATREYALNHLSTLIKKDSSFYEDLRTRWIKWHLDLVENYTKDKEIELELENIGGVILWCAETQKYETAKQIWYSLDAYMERNKYWSIRLLWWKYLEKESHKHGDIHTYSKAIDQKTAILNEMLNTSAEQCTSNMDQSGESTLSHA